MVNDYASRIDPPSQDRFASAGASPFVNFMLFIWIVGITILGKDFAYINVGSLYITEIVLFLLLVTNLRALNRYDVLLGAIIIFYLIGGYLKHEKILMVGKDIAWLYFLFFLRFFPSNFPTKYFKWIVAACVVALGLQVAAAMGLPALSVIKYRTAVFLLFLFLLKLQDRQGKSTITIVIIFAGLALLSDFKTLILVTVLTPVLYKSSNLVRSVLRPRVLVPLSAFFLILIFQQAHDNLMVLAIDTLNLMSDILNMEKQWAADTATWRSLIWSHSLQKLGSDHMWVFGTFPGYNFMDSSYLGVYIAGLEGGQGLGIVRTAHNIIVQMIMKTGIVGLAIYFFYLWKWLPKNKETYVYILLILICGLTSDILETPSRGPLAFCFAHLLAQRWTIIKGLDDERPNSR